MSLVTCTCPHGLWDISEAQSEGAGGEETLWSSQLWSRSQALGGPQHRGAHLLDCSQRPSESVTQVWGGIGPRHWRFRPRLQPAVAAVFLQATLSGSSMSSSPQQSELPPAHPHHCRQKLTSGLMEPGVLSPPGSCLITEAMESVHCQRTHGCTHTHTHMHTCTHSWALTHKPKADTSSRMYTHMHTYSWAHTHTPHQEHQLPLHREPTL